MTIASNKRCIACDEEIRPTARVCPHCHSPQSPPRWDVIKALVKWVGAIVTIITLIVGVNGVNGLYKEWRQRQIAVSEMVRAAAEMGKAGKYQFAWEMYEDAAELAPGSKEVRQGLTDLAMRWLMNVTVVNDELFSTTVDPLIPVLYRGLVNLEGTEAATVMAHIAYAYYLKYRDIPLDLVSIDDLYQQALEYDPNNPYANTLYAHWCLFRDDDVDKARPFFEKALQDESTRRWVRDMQLSALQNPISRHRIYSEQTFREPYLAKALKEAIIVANDMRRNDEPPADPKRREHILRCYGLGYKGEYVDMMLDALDPAEQLKTVEWLDDGLDYRSSDGKNQQRYVVARLTEAVGDTAQALALYKELSLEEFFHKDLNTRVDLGVERLSGVVSERIQKLRGRKYWDDPIGDADPWEFHAETLRNFDPKNPGGTNVSEALEFFIDEVVDAQEGPFAHRSKEAFAIFGNCRERVKNWYEEQEQFRKRRGGEYDLQYSKQAAQNAEIIYHVIWDCLGQAAIGAGELDRAVAELSDLEVRLAADDGLKYHVLVSLACAYCQRSLSQGSGTKARIADLEKAILVLQDSVNGSTGNGLGIDWMRIKTDRLLEPLRSDERYIDLIRGR